MGLASLLLLPIMLRAKNTTLKYNLKMFLNTKVHHQKTGHLKNLHLEVLLVMMKELPPQSLLMLYNRRSLMMLFLLQIIDPAAQEVIIDPAAQEVIIDPAAQEVSLQVVAVQVKAITEKEKEEDHQ